MPGLTIKFKDMKKPEIFSTGRNHTAVNVGGFDSVSDYTMIHPRTGAELHKVFLKEPTGSTGTEISVQSIAAGTEVPYFHTHNHNEETYIILQGQGKMQVDGECFPVREGSFVRIAPQGMRGIANDSDGELVVMVIQSREHSLREHTSADGTPFPVDWR